MIIFFISIHFTISIFFIPLVSNFHPVSFSFDFRASFNTFLVQFTSDKFFHHLLVWKSTYFTIIFNNNEVIIMGIEFYADRRGVCVCVCVFLFSTLKHSLLLCSSKHILWKVLFINSYFAPYTMCFSSNCFKDFNFITVFQQFNYELLWCVYFYSGGLLRFLNICVYIFINFENFEWYFLICFSASDPSTS